MQVELPIPTDPGLEAAPQDVQGQENESVTDERDPGGPGTIADLRFPPLGVDLLD